MKRLFTAIGLLLAWVGPAFTYELRVDEKEDHRQRCAGMYSRRTWGGAVEPFILLALDKLPPDASGDPIISVVIFEWNDEDMVGRYDKADDSVKNYICDDETIQKHLCNETQIGEFILHPNATQHGRTAILSKAVHLKEAPPINYPIKRTGYYCVATRGNPDQPYSGIVTFKNAYGDLPGSQIAKLPFYGGLTIAYAVIGLFWAFLYVQNRHDILPVQHYITAIIIFLLVEMLMTWGFYDYGNRHGSNVLSKVLMVIVAILNAGRNSFSFFLLLIVCLGYGVVKPSLGKTMLYVRGLGATHFVFGVIYAIASLTITPETAGPLVLLVILPLSATLTAFYVWTLNALKLTIKDLEARKQTVKAMMYKKLWWCILASLLVTFGFFFVNSFSFAGSRNRDFVPNNWKTRWFILDGWLNIVYLIDLSYIAYLWRPTANNRRFAMSDELAQDEEGFEVTSFGGSLDDEEEGHSGEHTPAVPSGATHRSPGGAAAAAATSPASKLDSAVPNNKSVGQKKTTSTRERIRESLDGEAIFAVGDEDADAERWSDAGDISSPSPRDSGERKRLTDKDK